MKTAYINPVTGGYEYVNGSLVLVHPTVNKANRLLLQRIGGDMANPSYGNPLYTTKNITADDVKDGINYALLPLTSTGEITRIENIKVTKTIRNRWNATFTIIISSADPITLSWSESLNIPQN